MLTNYLKITLAVMRRRKFFTFISLFGISITLSILVILTAFYDHIFSGKYPEVNRNRSLFSNVVEEKDTSKNGMRRGPMSLHYINNYIKTLKMPEKVAISSIPNPATTYGNGRPIKLFFKYTDPIFWEVIQFEFLEGRPFTQQDIDRNDAVVIINDETRDAYFGKGVSAMGKTFEFNGDVLRVIGVVRGCPITRMVVSSDIYMPYNLAKDFQSNTNINGSYTVIVLGKTEADLPAIQAEYADVVSRVPLPSDADFKPTVLKAKLDSYYESTVEGTFFDGKSDHRFFIFVTLFALLFMSLPAINLMNINVSRILERSSEIGIRKAFGASSNTLVFQFVIENILLTLFGGILALMISGAFIFWFNQSHLIAYADLSINWTVVAVAILLSLVFGLMSGVFPAWRMSQLPIVEALKA